MVDRSCLAIHQWNTWAPHQKVAFVFGTMTQTPSPSFTESIKSERRLFGKKGPFFGAMGWFTEGVPRQCPFHLLFFLSFFFTRSLTPNRRSHPGCCQTLWVSCGRVGSRFGMLCHIWQHRDNRVLKFPPLKKSYPSIPCLLHKPISLLP